MEPEIMELGRRKLTFSALGILLACQATAAQPVQSNSKEQSQRRLAELIGKVAGTYTRIADGAWQTSYKGKNMPIITVRIVTAEGGVFFFADLFDRKSLPLSRNLLLKIAELNVDYDYAKLALSENSLHV